jgi:hypothetical protein
LVEDGDIGGGDMGGFEAEGDKGGFCLEKGKTCS